MCNQLLNRRKHQCDAQAHATRPAASKSGSPEPWPSTWPIRDAAESAYEPMPCFHPIPATRTTGGAILLHKDAPDGQRLYLPCNTCLGCRMSAAKAWALRCQLELQRHNAATFTTLTYDEEHKPVTLDRRHLQNAFKKLRHSRGPFRFFASGEYGETTKRPHYHAILFGVAEHERHTIEEAWGQGQTYNTNVTPARIAYTAGYTSKKVNERYLARHHERVDPDTGEVYTWQPPFIQMSRRPGLGSHARQHVQSWRRFAIYNGQHIPVPKYLHEAWKAQATPTELEQLLDEKAQQALNRYDPAHNLEQAERNAQAQQAQTAQRRKY